MSSKLRSTGRCQYSIWRFQAFYTLRIWVHGSPKAPSTVTYFLLHRCLQNVPTFLTVRQIAAYLWQRGYVLCCSIQEYPSQIFCCPEIPGRTKRPTTTLWPTWQVTLTRLHHRAYNTIKNQDGESITTENSFFICKFPRNVYQEFHEVWGWSVVWCDCSRTPAVILIYLKLRQILHVLLCELLRIIAQFVLRMFWCLLRRLRTLLVSNFKSQICMISLSYWSVRGYCFLFCRLLFYLTTGKSCTQNKPE